ncbi:MAG: hypothetical protein ACR2NN_23770 [Bryobacteraceae bacterium]
MGLFTDGQVNSTQDLRNYENGILDTASLENIDLTGKMALAQDEIGTEILQFLLKQTIRDPHGFPYVFPSGSLRRKLGVSDVTVTPELKRWHALKTLDFAYADAYNNQLNDRYAGKQKQYEKRAARAELSYFETGVGISLDPMSRALAPILDAVGGLSAGATFYVQTSWINHAGQESSPSELVSYSTADSTQLRVEAVGVPVNAAGWNVYAGYTPDNDTLQNDAPIPVGTSWIMPLAGIRTGRNPGSGQTADRYVVNDRVLLRG